MITSKKILAIFALSCVSQLGCSNTSPRVSQNIDKPMTLGSALAIPRELFGVKIGEDIDNYHYKEVKIGRTVKQITPPKPMKLLDKYYIDNIDGDSRITSIIGTAEFSNEQECLDKKWEILQKLEKKYDTVAQFATYLTSINDDDVTAKCLNIAKTTKADKYRLEVVYHSNLTLPNVTKLFGVQLYQKPKNLPKSIQKGHVNFIGYPVPETKKGFSPYQLRLDPSTGETMKIASGIDYPNMQVCLQNMQNYRQQLETAYQMRMRKINNGWQIDTYDKHSATSLIKIYCEDVGDYASMILSLEHVDKY